MPRHDSLLLSATKRVQETITAPLQQKRRLSEKAFNARGADIQAANLRRRSRPSQLA